MKNSDHLICFDLDGVLIHSMTVANKIFYDTIERELGLPVEPYRKEKKIMALSAEERFDLLWKDEIERKGITSQQIEDALEAYRKGKMSIDIPALPKAVETVRMIAEHFEMIAAVSSNPDYIIKETLERLQIADCFQKITGLDHIRFAKPNPEIYEQTVDYFGIEAKNAMTFEDSLAGITSAKGAGMKVIAVATGLESKEELQKTPADLVLNDLTELKLEMVKSLF